jgi:subtilisin family serine protease
LGSLCRTRSLKGQAHPPGFTEGTFYDEATLNTILKTRDISALKMNSLYDHGSHVTGIAAGNGWIKENQFPLFTFVGVAPEADIIFTNGAQLADSATVADAVKFIFGVAAERGQACVINMSFGTHESARDGSSDLEKAIDRLMFDADGNPIPGRAVVVAAGNEADSDRHSRKNIDANGHLLFTANISPITFPADAPFTTDSVNNHFYVWYDGGAALRFRLTAPGSVPNPAGWVNPGEVKDLPAGAATTIAHVASLLIPDPRNGKKEIVFSIIAPAKFGDWKIEFEETSGHAAAIDIWIDRDGEIDIWARFIPGENVIDNTVTSPATAASVITAGAYRSEPGKPLNGERYGEICKFSGWGLDSIFGVTKEQTRPAVVAPGRRIVSANFSSQVTKIRSLEYFLSRFDGWTLSQHVRFSGTSQAAPHVTGVIALMFERKCETNFQRHPLDF